MEINTATISGIARLTRSGEFNDGTPWVNFTLSHSAYKGRDDDGKSKYENQYFECSMTGKMAGVVAEQLSTEVGHKVVVTGHLVQDKWQTPEGDNRSMVKLKVESVLGATQVGEGISFGGGQSSNAPVSSGAGEPF